MAISYTSLGQWTLPNLKGTSMGKVDWGSMDSIRQGLREEAEEQARRANETTMDHIKREIVEGLTTFYTSGAFRSVILFLAASAVLPAIGWARGGRIEIEIVVASLMLVFAVCWWVPVLWDITRNAIANYKRDAEARRIGYAVMKAKAWGAEVVLRQPGKKDVEFRPEG